MMINYGPPDGPERAWPIVLQLIERAPDENSLTFIGAGAVEDLVNKAGAQFVDRIVDRADLDPRFRRALRNVWYHPTVPRVLKELIESARTSTDG
jgi:50S ribosomal subunit-associated GTPase HflX